MWDQGYFSGFPVSLRPNMIHLIAISLLATLTLAAQPTNCVDNGANCALFLENKFCSSSLFGFDQKLNTCAATCKLCGGCVDADPNCPIFARNGFCDDTAFTTQQKIEKCRNTCGYCFSPCGDGWVYSETLKSCYKVLTRTGGLNFTLADQGCKTFGGNLTSIHSQQENQLVNGLGAQNTAVDTQLQTLIGGVKKAGGGVTDFRWTDGTPFDFKAFTPGQPDNFNNEQNCIKTWSTPLTFQTPFFALNKWDDDGCFSFYFNAICKKPAVF